MPALSVDDDEGPFRSRRPPTPPLGSHRNLTSSSNSRVSLSESNAPQSMAATGSSQPGVIHFGQSPTPPVSSTATSSAPRSRSERLVHSVTPEGTTSYYELCEDDSSSSSPSPLPSPQPSFGQSSRLSSPEAELSRLTLQGSPTSHQSTLQNTPHSHSGSSQPLFQFGMSTTTHVGPGRAASDWRTPVMFRPFQPKPRITPYNIHNEERPPHSFFTDAFQTALNNGLGIAKGIADMIQGMPDFIGRNPVLQGLLKQAESLEQFIGTDTRTVAVLGDSGEGKCRILV